MPAHGFLPMWHTTFSSHLGTRNTFKKKTSIWVQETFRCQGFQKKFNNFDGKIMKSLSGENLHSRRWKFHQGGRFPHPQSWKFRSNLQNRDSVSFRKLWNFQEVCARLTWTLLIRMYGTLIARKHTESRYVVEGCSLKKAHSTAGKARFLSLGRGWHLL